MNKKHNNDELICPKCGGTNITYDLSLEAYASGKIFNAYRCNDCGYKGMFFIKKIKERRKQKSKNF